MGMFGLLSDSRALAMPMVIAAGLLVALVQPVAAQEAAANEPPLMSREFGEFPKDKVLSPSRVRLLEIDIMKILNAGIIESEQQQKTFDDYFNFKLAELTWESSRADLPKRIDALKKQRLTPAGRSSQQQVHDLLNKKFLTALSTFALDKQYHPAARVNCLLLLGMLDQVESEIATPTGVGYAPALESMLTIVADKNQPDYIRQAALVGINRHAKLSPNSMTPKGRADTVKTLTQPIVFGNPEATAWARRTAARTLREMASKWPEANKPEVVAVAQQLMDDAAATLLERSEAARTLSFIDKAGFAGAQIPKLASSVGMLAAELGKSAADPNYKYVDEPGPGKQPSLQYLTFQLLCAHSAIKGAANNRGLQSAAPNESKAFLNELAGKVNDMVDVSANNKLQPEQAQSMLAEKGQQLEQWIKSKNGGDGATVAAGGR
jgi:hypothetical protein